MKYLLIAVVGIATLIACSPKTTGTVISETTDAEETTTTSNESMTFNDADVDAGKALFKEKCISCHYGRSANQIPQLVDSYSKERWDEILPEMIENAELNSAESSQIRQYIYWEISN